MTSSLKPTMFLIETIILKYLSQVSTSPMVQFQIPNDNNNLVVLTTIGHQRIYEKKKPNKTTTARKTKSTFFRSHKKRTHSKAHL